MVKKNNQKPQDQNLAIVGLIINIMLLPGLGSIIGGRTQEGIWQLALFVGGMVLGLLLTITIIGAIIGIPMMIIAPLAAWVWSLVTGIQMVKETSN